MKIRTAAVVALPVLAAAAWLYAGPLNPPSGPIASTGKTLTEVEPRIAINSTNTPGDADSIYRISASGSYYLPGNMVAGTGKSAIEIAASNVTIDLSGFTITSLSTLPSIRLVLTGRTNITIRNGNIGALGDGGIDIAPNLVGTPTEGGCVENVHVSGTSGVGILVGNGVLVLNCTASENGDHGIKTGTGCTVSHCSSRSNIGVGFLTGTGTTVTDCTASNNSSHGFSIARGGSVSRCTADSNDQIGIVTGPECTITGSSSTHSGSNGINAGGQSTITDCTASFSGTTGITASIGCTIAGSTSSFNALDGILAGTGSTVNACTVSENSHDGIVVPSDCTVMSCACHANGGQSGDGAGIHASNTNNRIQNNNCTGADRGIDVDGTGNIITGNTCSGNTTNWTVVTGNVCLVVSATPTISVINGDSGGTSPGSTNPFANFTY